LPILFITFASIIILALSFIGLIITKKSDLKLLEKESQNEKLKEKSRNDWTLYLHKLRENAVESINSQILIFTNINHELGNKLPQMKIDVDTLHEYLKSKESDSLNLLDEPVQKPLSIEDSVNIEKIGELINRMDNSLKYSINVINSMGMIIKLGPNNLKKETFNVTDFLNNEIGSINFDRKLIQIDVKCDSKLVANFDQFQFKILISNFIENAIRHGKFQIGNTNFILFNVYENDKNIIFEIINNGKPVDSAFTINDFVKPNSFFGETGNTGFGGYIIGMILTNHEGEIELIDKSDENTDFKVCFKISIPKI
jgi:signal transduction histidine kinase